jgi:DNA-binding NarL/FixJ family response regulator
MNPVEFGENDDLVLSKETNSSGWFVPKDPLNIKNIPVDFLVDGIIARRKVTVIAGSAGSGKTLLSLWFFLNQDTDISTVTRCKALFLTGADCSEEEVVRRSHKIGKNDGLYIVSLPQEVECIATNLDFMTQLTAGIIEHKFDVVIFDTIADFHKGSLNEADQANKTMSAFNKLAVETNAAVVLITHLSKSSSKRPQVSIEDIADSRVFGTKCDFGYVVKTVPSDSYNKIIEIIPPKSRSTKEYGNIFVEIVDTEKKLELSRTSKPKTPPPINSVSLDQRVRIREMHSSGMTYNEISRELKLSKSTISKYITG